RNPTRSASTSASAAAAYETARQCGTGPSRLWGSTSSRDRADVVRDRERLPRRFGPVGVEHSDEGARGGEETEPAARLREEHAPVRRPRRARARAGRVAG